MEGGEGGAGEVRKVNVVYFLSRNGEMEQPHLIRVRQRTHRDGVRLRDVKRWLSELRGKGMPDSFAWSYKRRYRTGYVWQDVADDDLITPVSDNEYVLKGSLTTTATPAAACTRPASSSSTVFFSPSAATSDSASAGPAAADPLPRGDPKPARPPETPTEEKPDAGEEVSPKPPSPEDAEEDEEPPRQPSEASAQTTRRQGNPAVAGSPLPVSSGGFCEIEEEAQPEGGGGEEKMGAPASGSCHSLLPGRRRGYAWCGGSGVSAFRSLLGCGAGAAEVEDAALLPVEPQRRGQVAAGARDSRGGGNSGSRSGAGEAAAAELKTVAVRSEACKPAREPRCSQCGRPFRPERLHAHMKSCKALKSQRKNMSSGKLPKESESNRAMLAEEASSFFLLSH